MGKLDGALAFAAQKRGEAPQPSQESALVAALMGMLQSQMERQREEVSNKDVATVLERSIGGAARELKADLGAADKKVESVIAQIEHLETCVADLLKAIRSSGEGYSASAEGLRKDLGGITAAVELAIKKHVKVQELPDLSPLVSAVEVLASRETPDYSAQLKAIQKAVTAKKAPEEWVFKIQRDGRGITEVIATKS